MRESMRRMLCLLVLMLCCAYGCVSVTAAPQTERESHAAGYGIGSTGPKPASDTPGGLGPQIAPGTPHPGTGVAVVEVNNKTGCPVKDGKVIPCLPCKAGVNSTDDAPCLPTETSRYHGVAESYGQALNSERDTVLKRKKTKPVQRTGDGHDATDESYSHEESLLSRPATVGNRNHTKVNTTDVAAAAVPGHPDRVPPTPYVAAGKEKHPAVPGTGPLGTELKFGVPVTPLSPVSNTSNGKPSFPGVHSGVTTDSPATRTAHKYPDKHGNPQFPGVHNKLHIGGGGTPSFAGNRGPARPPRADVDVSESSEEVSAPTKTQPKENNNQAETTAAPAQSESPKNTPNTPTKVTSPAIPTILQPPVPAKSETKPPKKRKADSSSSIGSVWVRVPLLIVSVLVSATVY
ncbi:uncharacterized protein TM35_000451160 [Trypanosoma theileri]|uniref:Mucin TcMUCII n=1 Tax=Trypanosoma theileri TaxID=67003 RepID=A0A1X0NIM8_9TRYP|nr:uncharacterized protein TM35_000451160 [Trypanosoma theileri]ORC84378.1 hypothetical protein TM35_000451160 [Trypanosoma theileri]